MNLIVAVDNNWAIGCKGNLLVHLPDDLKYFKEKTLDKVVVMGRKTLESLPGGKPLKNRVNIVLTRNKEYVNEDVIVCYSVESLDDYISKYNQEDVFIIGGADIYNMLIPYCKYAYVTKIDSEFEADKHITNLDRLDNWHIIDTSEVQENNGLEYTFNTYENRDIKLIN